MKIAICDDEDIFISEIKADIISIKTDDDNFEIYEFSSGESLLEVFHKNTFDLIILDIEMGDISGLQVAEYIRKMDKNVIIFFLTSYNSFVYAGYEVGAFRYILKNQPLHMRRKQLKAAVNEYFINHKSIVFPYKGGSKRFYLNDILYIDVLKRQITVHIFNENFSFVGKLSDYEKNLSENRFVKSEKSYLVNVNNIAWIDRQQVTMKNGQAVPVSRKYRENIEKAFINAELWR